MSEHIFLFCVVILAVQSLFTIFMLLKQANFRADDQLDLQKMFVESMQRYENMALRVRAVHLDIEREDAKRTPGYPMHLPRDERPLDHEFPDATIGDVEGEEYAEERIPEVHPRD